jgi:hypothetical protein
MNECMRGRPSRPLHRDLQWSTVLINYETFCIMSRRSAALHKSAIHDRWSLNNITSVIRTN